MSTFPQNSEAVRRRLVRMLTGDTERPRPPVTLAGPRTNGSAAPQPAPPPVPDALPARTGKTPGGHKGRTMPGGAEPTGTDGEGPYSHEELVLMDNRFRAALLRAFERGEESRASAAQAYVIPSRSLTELLAFPAPLW